MSGVEPNEEGHARGVAVLLGWVMLVTGLLAAVNSLRANPKSPIDAAVGGLTAIAGLVLAMNPLLAAKSIILVVMLVALVRGLVGLWKSFWSEDDRALNIVVAIVDLAVAFILWRSDLLTAARLVGIYIALTIILWGVSVVVAGSRKPGVATV